MKFTFYHTTEKVQLQLCHFGVYTNKVMLLQPICTPKLVSFNLRYEKLLFRTE